MYLACFLVAVVMAVSRVPCWGRAVVMVVSRWPASVGAVVLLVSMSPRRRILCAKKFALRGPIVGESAKKFAQCAENTQISAFLGLLGEFFRGWAAGSPLLGELSRGPAAAGIPLHEICRGNAPKELCWVSPRRRPPTSRAPAQREPGKLATASCRRKIPTPRRLPTRSG